MSELASGVAAGVLVATAVCGLFVLGAWLYPASRFVGGLLMMAALVIGAAIIISDSLS